MNCPKCGSAHTKKAGTRLRRGGAAVQRFRCHGCGHVYPESPGKRGKPRKEAPRHE